MRAFVHRPADLAAVINGLVVMIVPIAALVLLASLDPGHGNASSGVTAPDPAGRAPAQSPEGQILGTTAMVLAPFALIAAWRTRVHAQRWLRGESRGWQGVAEAGILAAAVAIAYLLPGIVTKPLEAPPFVIFYGGAALVLGLLAGLTLRMTALLSLRALGRPAVPLDPP